MSRMLNKIVFFLLLVLMVSGPRVLYADTLGSPENDAVILPPKLLLKFPGIKGDKVVRPPFASRTLSVIYTYDIDPDSFKATLNGEAVTAHFSPKPGIERVKLPFKDGDNRVVLTVAPSAEAVEGMGDEAILSTLTQHHEIDLFFEEAGIEVMPMNQKSAISKRKLGDKPPRSSAGFNSYNPGLKRPWEE